MLKNLVSTLLITILTTTPILSYTLAPGDTLNLQFINKKHLNTKQTIAPDGTLYLHILGRTPAAGQTLENFQTILNRGYSKAIQDPKLIIILEPRPIYVILHNKGKNTWEVKKAKTIEEAKALAGKNYTKPINYGDTITVETGKEKDFFENNWYKIITATSVIIGIIYSLNR